MHEHYLEKTGTYYRTNDFVAGRKTLVFIHGLSGSSSAWLPYETYFKDEYNVLTYDIRGHGKSKKYARYADYEIKYFVAELNELLLHIQSEHVILIAHSFAPFIALAFVEHEQYKEKVEALVLLSPVLYLEKRWLARATKPFLSMLVHLFELLPFGKKTGTHIDYTKFPNTGDWNIPRMIADISNTSLRIYLYVSRQSYETHPEKKLHELTVPTLIIHGKSDTISPIENAHRAHTAIPHSSLVVLDSTDHILVINHPQEVCTAIKRFLEQL